MASGRGAHHQVEVVVLRILPSRPPSARGSSPAAIRSNLLSFGCSPWNRIDKIVSVGTRTGKSGRRQSSKLPKPCGLSDAQAPLPAPVTQSSHGPRFPHSRECY